MGLGPRRISLIGDSVCIEGQLGVISKEIISINEVTIQRSCFWTELTVSLVDGAEHSIGGLAEQKAVNVRDAIFKESARIAESLGKRLKHVVRQLSPKGYIRYFDFREMHEDLADVIQQCGTLVWEHLDLRAKETLDLLARVESIEAFKAERNRLTEIRQIPIVSIDKVNLRHSCFWTQLTVSLADGEHHSVGGLAEWEAMEVRGAILEESASVAESLGMRLKDLVRQLSPKGYIRHFDSREIHDGLVSLVTTIRQCGKLARERLDQGAEEAFGRLARLESIEEFEAERKRLNDIYVKRTIPCVKTAAEPNLTDEQAEAIATDEDVTLVLAGAGTGKTKVIVGKVAHLVRTEGVSPNDILVLAFNRKAAIEIVERLSGDLSTAQVHTFHAFGRRVIADIENVKPTLEEESKLPAILKDILNELLSDPQQSDAAANFIASYHGAYESVFAFDTQNEYDVYIRSVDLKTLSGVRVKSFEEMEIVNYLTKHGVKFCYERPYEKRTETREYRQYHPDFFLPDYDIYIEHHALDKWDRPPRGWKGYKERVEWHRRTHKKYGTKLIETYSWQHQEGILLSELRTRLENEDVQFERVSQRDLVLQLARQLIEWLARLMAKFLNHVKTNRLSSDELLTRSSERGTLRRNTLWRDKAFLEVFEQVRTRYEQRLKAEGKLDFHDLINRAAQYISEGSWKTSFQYVLVDEFQDISAGRMKLLKALRRNDTAYFLVGDDWQSINRFAGSDVGLVRNCGDYLGHIEKRTLSQTFRFGDGILNPSTAFVKQNPEQTQRALTSVSSAEDKGITVVTDDNPATGLQRAREDIEASARGKEHSVLVLGRYKSSEDLLQRKSPRENFSTVHGAKGREADYVIVLDLKDGRWGFPSRIENNSLLDLVLPPVSEVAYPFAEERRLFYVAMTRARIGAYLVTDSTRPSAFVRELQKYDDIPQIGSFAQKCPRCGVGTLVKREGPYSVFMGCTEYGSEPSCRYTKDIDIDPDALFDG